MQPPEFVLKDPALSGRYQFGLLLLLGCSMGFRMPCARTSRLHSSREGHLFEHHIREEMQGHGSHSWKIQEEHVEKTTHFNDVIPWSILLAYQQQKTQDFETTVSNDDWLLCYGKPRRCTIFFRGRGVAIEKSVSRQTSWAVFVDSLKEKVNSPRWRYWNWLIGILASWVVNVM